MAAVSSRWGQKTAQTCSEACVREGTGLVQPTEVRTRDPRARDGEEILLASI